MAVNLGTVLVAMGLDKKQFSKGLKEASGELQSFGRNAANAGKLLTAGLTVPIVAVGAASIKFAADFDAAMTKSLAIMGDLGTTTREEFDSMREVMEDTAREVAKTTTFSAEQAAESYFFLASAGLDAKTSIEALPKVAAFAQAGAFDMAKATDLLTDAQSALGLTIRDTETGLIDVGATMENMARVSDVLSKANTIANATVEQFSTALTTKGGAALRTYRQSLEEGVAALAVWADQGVKGERAGTALNIVLRDLTSKALANKDAWAELGVSVFDADENIRGLGDIIRDLEPALEGMSDAQELSTLKMLGFTDKSKIFIQQLIGMGDQMGIYEEQLLSAGGATQEIADKQMESFIAKLGLFKDNVVDVAIELGNSLLPVLEDLLELAKPLVDIAGQAAESFANFDSSTQLATISVVAFAAAIGPATIALGLLVTGVGQIAGIAGTAAIGLSAMKVSLLAAGTAGTASLAGLGGSAAKATGAAALLGRSLGVLGPALKVVGGVAVAAFVGWGIGRLIGRLTGLDGAVQGLGERLLGVKRDATGAFEFELAETDIFAIEKAEERLGLVFERSKEGLREAVNAQELFNQRQRESLAPVDSTSNAIRNQLDELDDLAAGYQVFNNQQSETAGRVDETLDTVEVLTKSFSLQAKELLAAKGATDKLGKASSIAGIKIGDMALAEAVLAESARQASQELAESARQANQAQLRLLQSTEVLGPALEQAARSGVDALSDIGQSFDAATFELEALADLFEDTTEGAMVFGGTVEQGAQKLADFQAAAFAANPELREFVEGTEDATSAVVELSDAELNEMLDEMTLSADELGGAMMNLADAFLDFGGDASSGIGQAFAALSQLGASLDAIGTSSAESAIGRGDIGAGLGAITSGISNIAAATAAGSTASRAAGGAISGAAAGAQLGGPIGAAIGAGVGALVGFFRGRGAARLRESIEDVVGVTVSEAMAQGIQDAADMLDVGIFEATLLNLSAIFEDVGGVAAFGMEQAADSVVDLFNAVQNGVIPLEEGVASIGQAFVAMAEEGFVAGEVADASLLRVVARARQLRDELGEEIPEVLQFIQGELARAGEGIRAVVGGIQVFSPEDAQAQATIFSTTFWASVEEFGLLASVDTFAPAFAQLQESIAQFGGDVDLGGLGRIFEIASDEAFIPLLQGIEGLSNTLAGLTNSGFITAEAFAAIGQQGVAGFEQLIAAGLSEEEALQQIAPLLQNIVATSQAMGLGIDESTAALIAQAEASGIAFSTDPMVQIVDILTIIAETLGATTEQLATVGETAISSAGDVMEIGDAAESVASSTMEILPVLEDVNGGISTTIGEFEEMAGAADTVAASATDIAGGLGGIVDEARLATAQLREMATAGGGFRFEGFEGGRRDRTVTEFQHGGSFMVGPNAPFPMVAGEGPTSEFVSITPVSSSLESIQPPPSEGNDRPVVLQVFYDGNRIAEQALGKIEDLTRRGLIRVHARSVEEFGD